MVVTPDAIRGSFVSEWQNWTMYELPEACGEDLVYQGVAKDEVNVFGYAEVEAMFRGGKGAWFASKVHGAILVLDETHNVVRQKNRSVQENWHTEWAAMYDAYASAGHVLCLTGTPIEKDAKDIVPLLNLVTSVREGRAIFPLPSRSFAGASSGPSPKACSSESTSRPSSTPSRRAPQGLRTRDHRQEDGGRRQPPRPVHDACRRVGGVRRPPCAGDRHRLSVARMAYMNVYMQSYTQPLNSLKLY